MLQVRAVSVTSSHPHALMMCAVLSRLWSLLSLHLLPHAPPVALLPLLLPHEVRRQLAHSAQREYGLHWRDLLPHRIMTACGEKTKVGIGEEGRQKLMQDLDPLLAEASRMVPQDMSIEHFVQAERAAMSHRRTSWFGGGDILDHDFCVCLRAVIPPGECCCSPFFVRLLHAMRTPSINVWPLPNPPSPFRLLSSPSLLSLLHTTSHSSSCLLHLDFCPVSPCTRVVLCLGLWLCVYYWRRCFLCRHLASHFYRREEVLRSTRQGDFHILGADVVESFGTVDRDIFGCALGSFQACFWTRSCVWLVCVVRVWCGVVVCVWNFKCGVFLKNKLHIFPLEKGVGLGKCPANIQTFNIEGWRFKTTFDRWLSQPSIKNNLSSLSFDGWLLAGPFPGPTLIFQTILHQIQIQKQHEIQIQISNFNFHFNWCVWLACVCGLCVWILCGVVSVWKF